MPRKDEKDLQEEKAKEIEQPQQGMVEVPINLELLNNKLNYIISKIEQLTSKDQ